MNDTILFALSISQIQEFHEKVISMPSPFGALIISYTKQFKMKIC